MSKVIAPTIQLAEFLQLHIGIGWVEGKRQRCKLFPSGRLFLLKNANSFDLAGSRPGAIRARYSDEVRL
jgi:hypothetical protein